MSHRCTHENCFPDITCALGHRDRADCEHWKEEQTSPEEPSTRPQIRPSDVPWNGYSLCTGDLAILSGRGQPIVIGLVGPEDSGKTSLLAILYMWLLSHGHLDDWCFAGSWTLGGWESIVQHSRWTGEPPPTFPPHTSSTGRLPGVLHLTLRHQTTGISRDVLLTDAPGEWFTRWARSPGDATAAGARWVVERSDVLLVLVDSAALADSDKLPRTRRATRDMVERVGAEIGNRPLIVVWTKDDITIPQQTREALERACREFLPDAAILKTTVDAPETIAACFVCAVSRAMEAESRVDTRVPRLSHDPFLAFRGIHVSA